MATPGPVQPGGPDTFQGNAILIQSLSQAGCLASARARGKAWTASTVSAHAPKAAISASADWRLTLWLMGRRSFSAFSQADHVRVRCTAFRQQSPAERFEAHPGGACTKAVLSPAPGESREVATVIGEAGGEARPIDTFRLPTDTTGGAHEGPDVAERVLHHFSRLPSIALRGRRLLRRGPGTNGIVGGRAGGEVGGEPGR
jgi:hypothetical protein